MRNRRRKCIFKEVMKQQALYTERKSNLTLISKQNKKHRINKNKIVSFLLYFEIKLACYEIYLVLSLYFYKDD